MSPYSLGTRMPVSPSSITSALPPVSDRIMGLAWNIASFIAMLQPSMNDGSRKASLIRCIAATSGM